MKTISLNLDEAAFEEITNFAGQSGRTPEEVIAEAVDYFRRTRWRPRHSLRDFKPLGLQLKHPDAWKVDDILDEMINDDRD